MKNVLYPIADLTDALLVLLKNLTTSDWHKQTELNCCKVDALANHLIEAHHPNAKPKNFTVPKPLDSDIHLLSKKIEDLKKALEDSPTLTQNSSEASQHYCYCWLLQQYIRQAINSHLLLAYKFYFPFLNEVMFALPNHYLSVDAKEGTNIKIEIVGDAGGVWAIEKTKSAWQFINSNEPTFSNIIYLDQQIAWLLFSNALHVSEIGQYFQIIGDRKLGSHFLSLRAEAFV